MKIYDISLTIRENMVVWPGDPPVCLQRFKKLEDGAHNNVSALAMSVHSGTHIDAPYHFLAEGATAEVLPLELLTGEAQVIHLPDAVDVITEKVLAEAGIQVGCVRLLLRTRNSHFWAQNQTGFQPDFAGISPDGAEYLVKRGIRLVGLDYLSIAPYQKSRPTHEILLKADVIPLEGIDLHAVPAGIYQLYCLPLKLAGSDGAPVRAILIGQ
jgi:arylformamidase